MNDLYPLDDVLTSEPVPETIEQTMRSVFHAICRQPHGNEPVVMSSTAYAATRAFVAELETMWGKRTIVLSPGVWPRVVYHAEIIEPTPHVDGVGVVTLTSKHKAE
jgi:hypothetical protein